MRFAYADPPYPGQAKRLYGKHKDYAGEVDHAELMGRLERDYDGWALSTGSKQLPAVLKLCPDTVRVLIWRKPGVPFGDNFLWCYEPVILKGLRRPLARTADLLSAVPPGSLMTFRARPEKDVTGAKPAEFCRWVFHAAGLTREDEFEDLYPGSGRVLETWRDWAAQLELEAA